MLFSQNFMSFYRPQIFFLGNIFKYLRKKSAIFAENMKKVGVSFQKSAIFADIWGQIKNKKFVKKKKQYAYLIFFCFSEVNLLFLFDYLHFII